MLQSNDARPALIEWIDENRGRRRVERANNESTATTDYNHNRLGSSVPVPESERCKVMTWVLLCDFWDHCT